MLDGACASCGFDPAAWSDADATSALARMPEAWEEVVSTVRPADVSPRVVPAMWSIAEYVDHVRETMFVMRFVLDVAVATPGTDLGHPSPPPLGPRRDLDVTVVLALFGEEVAELCRRLGEVPAADLDSAVVLAARSLDGHWVVRNALHEAMHHLGDVRRLAAAAVIDASPPNPVGRLPAGPPASPR